METVTFLRDLRFDKICVRNELRNFSIILYISWSNLYVIQKSEAHFIANVYYEEMFIFFPTS
jgi:hypothetical protein